MANRLAVKKLTKEYNQLLKAPVDYVRVTPEPDNMLLWHYVIIGPADSPYVGGIYYGRLQFPTTFPMAPPAIYMETPSGRFNPGKKICTTMSDFHPETWSPSWTIDNVLIGLLSFMLDDNDGGVGSVKASEKDRRKFAKQSLAYNRKQIANFDGLFPDIEKLLVTSKSSD